MTPISFLMATSCASTPSAEVAADARLGMVALTCMVLLFDLKLDCFDHHLDCLDLDFLDSESDFLDFVN